MFTGCRGRGLRIVYGCLPDVEDEADGLFTDFYRVCGLRLTDCSGIFIGFGGEGFRIVYEILPDLGEEAYGLLADFYRILGEEAYGLFPKFLLTITGISPSLIPKKCGSH